MTSWFLLCCATALTACGAPALLANGLPPESELRQKIVVGQTTSAQVLAALGPAKALRFDSGYQVWLYQYAAGAPAWINRGKTVPGEYVILFDKDGVVRKTRRREPPAAVALPH